MIPFLQAIFECDIQEYNTTCFLISKFYSTTKSWREDALHYRETLKSYRILFMTDYDENFDLMQA